jgi:hypothetical protein
MGTDGQEEPRGRGAQRERVDKEGLGVVLVGKLRENGRQRCPRGGNRNRVQGTKIVKEGLGVATIGEFIRKGLTGRAQEWQP